jgi:hypothetical protein
MHIFSAITSAEEGVPFEVLQKGYVYILDCD